MTIDEVYTFNNDMGRADGLPLSYRDVEDPLAGPGNQIVLHCQTLDRRWRVDLAISLFANDTIIYDIAVLNAGVEGPSPTFQHFSYNANAATLLAEGDLEALSD